MRLILLAKSTPVHLIGGVETHVALVARTAAELGHEVQLVTTAHPRGIAAEEREGVRITYLRDTPPALSSRRWFRASAAFVRPMKADLVMSFGLSGLGLGREGSPRPHWVWAFGTTLSHVISEWHNHGPGVRGWASYPRRALSCCYWGVREWCLWKKADGIIATDDVLFQKLSRRGYCVVLSYNGTDPRSFRPDPTLRAATRRTLGLPEEAFVLLMVATVNRQKGIWVGVEAFRHLAGGWPRLHLVIVGDGPDRPRLQSAVRGDRAAERIHFVGAVPLPETAAFFAAADLFLYPTFRREGLPNAIVQAMAAGLPVVATDRGGISSAVQHGETGLLLPRPEAHGLGEAVAGLLAEPSHLARMGERARALAVARFDIRTQVVKLLKELEKRL